MVSLQKVHCDARDLLRQHFWEISENLHSTKARRNRAVCFYTLKTLTEIYSKNTRVPKEFPSLTVKKHQQVYAILMLLTAVSQVPPLRIRKCIGIWCSHSAENVTKSANHCQWSLPGMLYNLGQDGKTPENQ